MVSVKMKHPVEAFQLTNAWSDDYIAEYKKADSIKGHAGTEAIWNLFSKHHGVMYSEFLYRDEGYFSVKNHYGNETTVHIGDWIVPIGQDKYGHDLCFAMTNEQFEQYFTEDGVAVLD